jgi:hypothetical protein
MFNLLLLLFIFYDVTSNMNLAQYFIGLFSCINNLYEASVNKLFYSQSVQSVNPLMCCNSVGWARYSKISFFIEQSAS